MLAEKLKKMATKSIKTKNKRSTYKTNTKRQKLVFQDINSSFSKMRV